MPNPPAISGNALDDSAWPPGSEVLYVGMGCFWGAEKKYWNTPGVIATATGYQGGSADSPTYQQVCTGRTGHAENVKVVYDPRVVSTYEILRIFWENHDPTQGMRQGNDMGSQYRSTLYWTNPEQERLAKLTASGYSDVLRAKGLDPITTELAAAEQDGHVLLPFHVAEDYHQKYLWKNPHGYDCHAHTGIDLPALEDLESHSGA